MDHPEWDTPCVHRNSPAVRQDPAPSPHLAPVASRLRDSASEDLATLRLLLHQHLDDLRARGVGDEVLRPIEHELRRFDETVDQLIEDQQA